MSALPQPLIHFKNLGFLPGIAHGVTTRQGPAFGQVGTDEATAAAAAESAHLLEMENTAWVHQVHGGTILKADRPGLIGQADALVCDTPGLLVAGRSADCPIVLAAGKKSDGSWAVGFAHASWRSTLQRITGGMIGKLVDEMRVLPHTLSAAVAPSAGPCCYEVGQEVKDQALEVLGPQVAEHFHGRDGNLYFDLWSANRAQLIAAQVPAQNIEISEICTICQGEDFWSWRVQGKQAGRFAGLIGAR